MSTFLDVATDSIAELGQVGIGQSVSIEQASQALRVANRLLGKWSVQRLMLYVISTRAFALSNAVRDYTVGPAGATFTGARPTFVESAQATVPGSSMQIQMSVLDKSQWDAIDDLGATCGPNGVPNKIWPEYSFPNLGFHVHPIPSTTVNITLGTWEQLAQIATLFTVLNFPPGYEEAFQHCLAMELAPFYDMQISQDLAQLAVDSLLKIQAVNAQGLGGAFGDQQTLRSPNLGAPKQAAQPAQGQ